MCAVNRMKKKYSDTVESAMVSRTVERQNVGRPDRRTKRTLSEAVYDQLVDRIIRGRIRYGHRLNIKVLARQFGVSPMPIRDAIKRLEAENIVVVQPRSNCYVRIPTQEAVLQAVESRQMLELFAIEKTCRTVSHSALRRLARIVDLMAAVVARTDGQDGLVPEYIELDHRFHAEICRLAGNEYVQRFYRETSLHLSMSFRYGLGMCHGMRDTFEEHKAIYSYLVANSDRAVAALRKHLEKARQNLVQEYELQADPP